MSDQFRTASATALLAELIVRLLADQPEIEYVIEIGAGDGELLDRLRHQAPRLRCTGVDLRPPAKPSVLDWRTDHWEVGSGRWGGPAADLFDRLDRPTMIICAEWLDDLPGAVAVWDQTAWRGLRMRADGREELGDPLADRDEAWLQRWWPDPRPGARAECGLSRDLAWSAVINSLRQAGGLALMIDYGHTRDDRPYAGSLTGYADGCQVPARADPMLNLTAHVAVDAVTAAGEDAGAVTEFLLRQRSAVARLMPDLGSSRSADVLGRLQRDSERRFLAETLGDHWWLLQKVSHNGYGVARRRAR